MKKIHLIIDLESTASLKEHARYQASERYTPKAGNHDSGRRGQRGQDDPLSTPRWPFQSILAAVILKCVDGDQGNITPAEMQTFSRRNMDEKQIIASIFAYLATMPAEGVELVTYGGGNHDLPLLVTRAMAHGLTLPPGWGWLAFGGSQKAPHLDLLRVLTGGFKLRQVHMAEFAAVINVPAKTVDCSWSITALSNRGDWSKIEEICESDVITTAFLFASWKTLLDGRVAAWTVHDLICRKLQEFRPNRSYCSHLHAKRGRLYEHQFREAKAKLEIHGLPETVAIRRSNM